MPLAPRGPTFQFPPFLLTHALPGGRAPINAPGHPVPGYYLRTAGALAPNFIGKELHRVTAGRAGIILGAQVGLEIAGAFLVAEHLDKPLPSHKITK